MSTLAVTPLTNIQQLVNKDLVLSQKRAESSNISQILIRPIANTILGFDANGDPATYTAGDLITVEGALPLSGGTMTGPILLANGTAAAPSMAFASDTGTGFYRPAASQIGISIAGGLVGTFFASGSGVVLQGGGSNYISLPSSGAVALNAAGTNQSITLTPSGTGNTVLASGNLLLNGVANGTGVLQLPTTYANTNGIAFGTATILWPTAAGALALDHIGGANPLFQFNEAGTKKAQIGTSSADLYVDTVTAKSIFLRTNSTLALTLDSSQNIQAAKKITSYNGITTAGQGVPVIVAAANITAQSAAGNITTYTNGAADGDFEVSAQMSVTASTTLATTLTCTYTDAANVARTMILPIVALTGTFVAAGAITGAGASIWHTPKMRIRAKASTAITILTSTGTFTGVTFSASGTIAQLA